MVIQRFASALAACLALAGAAFAQEQRDFYRVVTYELPAGLQLEASGLAALPDGRLAVAIRRGEIWILDKPLAEPATVANVGYKLFATGLHEVLGLAWHEGALYATQRAEVTRIRDTDGDGVADEYLAVASGWGVSGAYHEYAYGPVFDAAGNAFTTLNSTMGNKWSGAGDEAKATLWRGWCVMTPPGGRTQPWAAGFRSPCGIGTNAAGDLFVTDQQGTWFGTNPLLHVRKGAFFGHAESIADTKRPDSPVKDPGKLPQEITVAQAAEQVPGYCLPAVWFPYLKMGQSPTGLHADMTGGKFGPFAGQLFVGEFVHSGVNRVFLEKVGGEYQGACFPFIGGLQSAALSVNFLADGSMVVGQSNRGWNSYGNRGFGLQRIVWTARTPLEVEKMEALPDGFRFTFTQPIDPASLRGAEGFIGQSYTYLYHAKYGSPETDPQALQFSDTTLSADQRSVALRCANLRAGYVHEIELPTLLSAKGESLWHRQSYYTLNRVPH
ncbi:MAG: hypothetical protein WCF18_23040 [Chthoniobacteraceae bacterium]